jgi:NAD-dependent dihydropyrimidine dehydrogenase PreA subunit
MIAHYGYTDGTGEYYIIIDTDKCDGCGKCVEICPKNVYELHLDDYEKSVVRVRADVMKSLHYDCLGYHRTCINDEKNCQNVCSQDAINHTW